MKKTLAILGVLLAIIIAFVGILKVEESERAKEKKQEEDFKVTIISEYDDKIVENIESAYDYLCAGELGDARNELRYAQNLLRDNKRALENDLEEVENKKIKELILKEEEILDSCEDAIDYLKDENYDDFVECLRDLVEQGNEYNDLLKEYKQDE